MHCRIDYALTSGWLTGARRIYFWSNSPLLMVKISRTGERPAYGVTEKIPDSSLKANIFSSHVAGH
jgi:hypothetical protein